MIAALPLVTSALSALTGPSQAASAAATRSTQAGDGFASMLASLTGGTVDKMRTSEAMSVAGIEGKASTQSVVEAVMQAQESLQTALAVRDKVVSAFQDVSRMSI